MSIRPRCPPASHRRAPAYEVNEARVAVGGNLAMLVADNLTNWAIVRGSDVAAPAAEELDSCVVTVSCDGEERFSCTAADEVDNP